jgi:hypothetical protein
MSGSCFVFFLTKLENRRAKQILSGGLVPVGGGRMRGEGMGGGIWCKYCVHMYINGKMRPVETAPGMVGKGKGEW